MATPRRALDWLCTVHNIWKVSENMAAAARSAGIPANTFKNALTEAQMLIADGTLVVDRYGLARMQSAPKADEAEDAGEPLAERERRRLIRERDEARAELNKALDELNQAEDIRKHLFDLTEEPLAPPRWSPVLAKGMKRPEVPILFCSDFQVGETIRPEEVDHYNAFNLDIFRARYRRMLERTLDLLQHHRGANEYPVFYYLRGGDGISNEIHLDLERTNDAFAIPAIRALAEEEAAGLKLLHDELKCPIRVISVPGNHDRTTLKPMHKGYVETSYDSIIVWWLEGWFRKQDWISFHAPLSGDAFFSVFDTNFLLTHGDRMGSRGGQGFIGPIATIARGHKKIVDEYITTGRRVDVVLTGHLHTSVKTEHGFGNGSLAGYSEYARSFRAKPAPPKQWLFKVNESRGLVSFDELFVGGKGEGTLCDKSMRAS